MAHVVTTELCAKVDIFVIVTSSPLVVTEHVDAMVIYCCCCWVLVTKLLGLLS